ncbi:uncharacterized protein LOC133289837 [Gastrolobium bilobum]|uniref:uncharacterized protein LOC133289837 n=1 Tax=Gastrolobium bilobum TaxID=150636 RepID=UPI002AB0CE09|nr:uncharacterized protein LOC133289837 [Gastrolobium bilobum]
MLLGSSISNTKKFFQKTLQNFKSFFSPGYQKLPKRPPHNHTSYSVAAASVMDMDNDNPSYQDLEKFYSDFTEQWDSEKEKARRKSKKKAVLSSPAKQEKEVHNESFVGLNNAIPAQKNNQMEKREEYDNQKNKSTLTHQRGKQQDSSLTSMCMRENRNCMVEKKLRELEMLDMSNVDYILDIEEVLHYYSRLTCPAYLEIMEKFFMEMYSEFFGCPARPATPRTHSINSKLKLRSMGS